MIKRASSLISFRTNVELDLPGYIVRKQQARKFESPVVIGLLRFHQTEGKGQIANLYKWGLLVPGLFLLRPLFFFLDLHVCMVIFVSGDFAS